VIDRPVQPEADRYRPRVAGSSTYNGEAIARSTVSTVPVRLAAVVVIGLGVGVLTAVLQRYLDSPWLSLVNSSSPWLTPMFATGGMWRRPRAAALSGLAVGLLELAGYYITAGARGYPSGGEPILLFWGACAVMGGPVFGLAGWAWWREAGRLRGLGAAALPAAFWSEAVVVYGFRLHYLSSAVLFGIIGLVALAVLGRHDRQHGHLVTWLLVVFPAAAIAEVIIGMIYSQAY
jgi:hypothetical protein